MRPILRAKDGILVLALPLVCEVGDTLASSLALVISVPFPVSAAAMPAEFCAFVLDGDDWTGSTDSTDSGEKDTGAVDTDKNAAVAELKGDVYLAQGDKEQARVA